jgi:tetratricopeptide (TPR) repeat protein
LAVAASTAGDVQELVDSTGLVEFEVGKALYGLITAGFAHRVGTSAPEASPPRVNDARVEEHRNLGIAFYRTGMLDEATREFRRVAELRPAEANAPFHLGLIALRQARWEEAADAFKQAVEKGRPACRAPQPRCAGAASAAEAEAAAGKQSPGRGRTRGL